MTKTELMQSVRAAIDRRAADIIAVGEEIRRHPELGFKEFKTSRLVAQTFERMGLAPRTGLALTGVRADAAGRGGDGPTFALLGELDALVVAGHPVADPETGAAHACGHNAQVAGMLGAAMGLLDAKAFDHLAGRVAFIGVPAEEYGDVAWRVTQRDAGKLEFLGGKPEMLRLGHLDDVDMAMMIHATPRPEEGKFAIPVSNNGCVVKTVRYIGKAAHAGGMPHLGINALYAAQIGLMGINAIRETFRDEDTIRVHPIMTHGGSQVNVIPADVRLETFVRGKTLDAIADADRKVDRALRAGALALGAKVEIETLPGYMPMRCDPLLVERFRAIAGDLVGAEHVRTIAHRTGSTDMGDLAQVMPILHPYVGGAKGTSHGADFEIEDQNLIYLTNAKALASMVVDLLCDGAAVGREVLARAKPPMTKEAYLEFQRRMSRREVYEG
ncbi:MAG: amidohydrolase [Candidatus Rokubacteria bacterium RIFCSPLOWO2_02_FULL_71_18]|nr:MAG: amidohydrolase [Candidatus Rokubacteria bacterium RIFCSPLOWO2_02_FULL_71_18]